MRELRPLAAHLRYHVPVACAGGVTCSESAARFCRAASVATANGGSVDVEVGPSFTEHTSRLVSPFAFHHEPTRMDAGECRVS